VLNEQRSLIGVWNGNLSKHIMQTASKPNPAEFFLNGVLSFCNVKGVCIEKAKESVIAIDAPLGWPTAFRKLLCSRTESRPGPVPKSFIFEPASKITNPFLHRKTEMLIGEALSTVQDSIGSQSTKALFLLQAIQAASTGMGVWTDPTASISLIETYPAPCVRSLPFLERMKFTQRSVDLACDHLYADQFDAFVCSSLAFDFAGNEGSALLAHPPEDFEREEGWIFVPIERLQNSVGVSYGKLLGEKSSSNLHTFTTLIGRIQIAVILEACIAVEKKKNTALADCVKLWLSDVQPSEDPFINTSGHELRTLFMQLHPKTKDKDIPQYALFDRIAQTIRNEIKPAGK